LQHVSAKVAMSGAEMVRPTRLPVPHRSRGGLVPVRFRHAWILHRPLMVKLAAAGVACLALGGLIAVHDKLWAVALEGVGFVQGHVADAGFAITSIEITGQTLSQEQDIVSLLGIEPDASTFNFDVEAARTRLRWLRAVEGATIRKIYPGRLEVKLVERVPVARWRSGGITYLVDAQGRTVGEDGGSYSELPLVLGEGAADDALVMIMALEKFEALQTELVALSRIGDRRWDMIYRSGLRVQLPEQGVSQALSQLQSYQQDYALLDRDVTVIDLRVRGTVSLTPSAAAAEQIKEAQSQKKPKRHVAVDPSYATPDEGGDAH